jgi:hypothetical protein
MDKTKILPIVLMIIDVAAAVVYCCDGDYRRAVYWIAAAVLTLTVTI